MMVVRVTSVPLEVTAINNLTSATTPLSGSEVATVIQNGVIVQTPVSSFVNEGGTGSFSSLTVTGAINLGATGYLTPDPTAFIPSAINNTTGTTIPALDIAGGFITRTGPSAAFTDTTDTAVNILAYIGAFIPVGYSLYMLYINNSAFPATLSAGAGVTISGGNIVPPNSLNTYQIEPTSATALSLVLSASTSNTTANVQSATNTTLTTFAVGQLTGSPMTVYISTAATPGSIATRTATQMIADLPYNVYVGTSWFLRVINVNAGSNTMTITGGSGVTLSGLATIAANTYRDFSCVVTATGTPAITFTDIGTGTYS